MKTLRRHWYNIGGVIALASIAILLYAWNDMAVLQRLLYMNFIALLIHQYEEYGFPGGEPAIMNMVLQPSSRPDRYPLNQNSAMITNVVITYIVYLVPVFFPDIIWLGLAPILFGISQFIVHGIVTNKKLRSFYNPGLGAVVFLHIPIGIYYIYQIQTLRLASGLDWLVAVIYLFILAFIVVNKMTYSWLADKNSPYPFYENEMKRFNIQEKIIRLSVKSKTSQT